MNQSLEYGKTERHPGGCLRKFLTFAGISFAVIALVLAVVLSPVAFYVHRFNKRMAMTERQAVVVRAAIAGDPRFAQVRVTPCTVDGGCLLIDGEIPDGSMPALQAALDLSAPPAAVQFMGLREASTTGPAPTTSPIVHFGRP